MYRSVEEDAWFERRRWSIVSFHRKINSSSVPSYQRNVKTSGTSRFERISLEVCARSRDPRYEARSRLPLFQPFFHDTRYRPNVHFLFSS